MDFAITFICFTVSLSGLVSLYDKSRKLNVMWYLFAGASLSFLLASCIFDGSVVPMGLLVGVWWCIAASRDEHYIEQAKKMNIWEYHYHVVR